MFSKVLMQHGSVRISMVGVIAWLNVCLRPNAVIHHAAYRTRVRAPFYEAFDRLITPYLYATAALVGPARLMISKR